MLTTTEQGLENLAHHPEPLIRWKYQHLFGDKSTPEAVQLKQELALSPVLQKLLSDRDSEGRIPYSPYDKWFGAHWVLSILADFGYPQGDLSLKPLMEQCYQVWLSQEHEKYISTINGRVRRCASQEGNCIYYSLALGLSDDRTDELASRLLRWQWDDGGWNCDKRPEAAKSSFHESLIPLRGLAYYARYTGDAKAQHAVERAAQIFLKRQLFMRIGDSQVMDKNFVSLHYPGYWHYDVLFGLKVLAEAGFITDPRCSAALDLLQGKQLPDGGFPAEERYYRVDDKQLSGHSRVDWGGTSKVHSNPYVTLDALWVLKQSGRLAA